MGCGPSAPSGTPAVPDCTETALIGCPPGTGTETHTIGFGVNARHHKQAITAGTMLRAQPPRQ
ncbi:hypothetical protein GCM10010222_58870 [Streptomyces tanashiensis]|nr:hypothetical protein GCM10010222_58870 [Streptomyces tanashiensis]